MKQFTIIVFLIFGLSNYPKAQNAELDSLEILISTNAQRDTIRVINLNKAAYLLWHKDNEKTLAYANEALDISNSLDYLKGKASALRNIGIHYWAKNDEKLALEYFHKSLELSEEIEYAMGIAHASGNVAMMYSKQNDFYKALEYQYKALSIKEKEGNKQAISVSLMNIGTIYFRMEEYEKALEYYRESLPLKEEVEDEIGIVFTLSNIAMTLDELGKTEEAIKAYDQSLELAGDNKSHIQNTYNNLGALYFEIGNDEKAKEYFTKSLKLAYEIDDDWGISDVTSNFAAAHLKWGNYQLAIDYSKQSMDIAYKNELRENIKKGYNHMALAYAALGNYKKAYENQVKFKAINDSIFNESEVKKITGLEYKYAFEKEKQQIEADQARKELIFNQQIAKQRWTIIGVVCFSILVTIATVFAYRAYKIKRDSTIELTNKNKHIQELRASEKMLSEEALASKERELATMAMASHEKNALLEDLGKKLTYVEQKMSSDLQPDFKEIKKSISDSYSLDKSWDSFLHKFKSVHPDFFNSLKTRFPKLTNEDLKVCAYLKIGMNNKEIAKVSHITVGSVKSKINRLKKKLDMSPEDSIRDFII